MNHAKTLDCLIDIYPMSSDRLIELYHLVKRSSRSTATPSTPETEESEGKAISTRTEEVSIEQQVVESVSPQQILKILEVRPRRDKTAHAFLQSVPHS